MEYSFELKCLKDIPIEKYDKDFAFIVDGKRYQTPRIVADLLSPQVRKLHFIDSTITEFYIDTINDKKPNENEERDYFSEFLRVITTDTVELDSKQQKYYSIYFYKLGNINEYLRFQQEFSTSLNIDNAIDRLLQIEKITINFSEVIDNELININELISFVSSHFYEISTDKLKQLSFEQMSEILRSGELKIQDEDSLLELLIELYEKDHTTSELFSMILFRNLSERSFERFIKTVEFEVINICIWNSICERLLPSQENNDKHVSRYITKYGKLEEKHGNVINVEFKGDELNGIITYLKNTKGENLAEKGELKLSAGCKGFSGSVDNLIKYDSGHINKCFYNHDGSKFNEEEGWIEFDFVNKKVNITSYTLRTSVYGVNSLYHPKTWRVLGSNDRREWDIIDKQTNNSALNGKYKQHRFECESTPAQYRYIRYIQDDSWYSNRQYCMILTCVEFFGTIST